MIGLVIFAGLAHGQDTRKVPISFLPPPLENATYSLGIYEAKSGKLVRRLQEIAPESAFTVGLNGLMTSWDGKDDEGKAVAPGRYAARGYAVGAMKVEGEQILGNDWAKDSERMRILTVQAITLIPEDDGLAVLALTPEGAELLARYGRKKNELVWQTISSPISGPKGEKNIQCSLTTQGDYLVAVVGVTKLVYRLSDGGEASPISVPPVSSNTAISSTGKGDTVWRVEDYVLDQYSPQGERLRSLTPKDGEPLPLAVAASRIADRLYLLESNGFVQRVRGLSWKETTHEGNKEVSNWETFFERSIQLLPLPGRDENAAPTEIELTLAENPLSPGKASHLKLNATFDVNGSYLGGADGLHLRQISQRRYLRMAKLAKGKVAAKLSFLQWDGAAWDEFSIEGTKNIMEFDAGEIEMTADGEKTHAGKTAEPPDL